MFGCLLCVFVCVFVWVLFVCLQLSHFLLFTQKLWRFSCLSERALDLLLGLCLGVPSISRLFNLDCRYPRDLLQPARKKKILSTPFLLSELYRSAPMHVACLHTATDYPRTDDVQWSVVYIAGGHTLISSRVYERVDVHDQAALIRGLHQRYPDLVDVNSYLVVKAHWSIRSIEPDVNHA